MKHSLAGILDTQHRRAITAVISRVRAKSEKHAFRLMPIANRPEGILEHEILSGFGGKTEERVMGEAGKTIAGISSQSKVYMPGSYQESIPFNERDLLRLRKAGSIGDRGVTGLTSNEVSITSKVAEKLELRLENRMQQLAWDSMFNGTFVYNGQTYTFGIPEANQLDTASNWDTDYEAGEANPIEDLIDMSQNEILRKYVIKEIIMNPHTAAKSKKAIIKLKQIHNSNVREASLSELLSFYCPELPAINIVRDAYQDETISADGKVEASEGKYFVPNGKFLWVPDFGGTDYPQYGELQLTENMNDPSATVDRPAQGSYLFFDEEGLKNRKSPGVEIVAGFNGGPNLMRPFDVIIGNAY